MSNLLSLEQPGELSLLNVGTGDTKISFDPDGPEQDRKTAAALVKDMIRKGYAVLVEVGRDDKGPLYRRAKDFDEKTCEYIVAGLPPEESDLNQIADAQEEPSAPRGRPKPSRKRKSTTSRVPAGRAKAVAVGKTAGG